MSDPDPGVRSIFCEALERPAPEGREAYLDEACRGDPTVRARVEELLRAHDQAGGFLRKDPPAYAPTVWMPPISERPGRQIGPYKLLEQIGTGGFGVVFMAEQERPVRRRVALKVIKPGMDTGEVVARFEAERQALALMDHPNIARVLDAGATETGRPYFVMELVKGVPITEYCDRYNLATRERLELFAAVCQAVQHAHTKGVIHRDIKPSNVLVTLHDGRPVPKVIDFGVSKAINQRLTERTLFTQFAQMIGTPLYMSPEQAELSGLDVDTRSDVYSLGVLLYELLTGTTPFERRRLQEAAFDEIRRIIREEEPPRPSLRLSALGDTLTGIAAHRQTEPKRLRQLVQGELDWIVMKALEKDRTRRYETANGFAADVLRYLADEPVQACPPSARYRLRKFARRNKGGLATAAVVVAALLLGIVVSTRQAVRATKAERLAQTRLQDEERARREAETARDGEAKQRRLAEQQSALAEQNAAEAERERRRAEDNFAKARRAVDEYLTQITENELLSVPGLQPLREDLLEAALGFYAEFTQERADDTTLRRELASAHFRLGTIQRELGNTQAAQEANREAIRLFEQLRDQREANVDQQAGLAHAYFFDGRHDEAVKLCQAALQAEPGHADTRSLLADTYNQLAVAGMSKNDVAAALRYHRQAFELREALVRDFPDDPRYLAQLGGTVNNLGVLLSRQGNREEALAMFERAVEYSAGAYERAPHSILWGRWLCQGLRNVSSLRAASGQEQRALQSYERLAAVSRKLAFENPAVGSLRGELYRAYLDLAKYRQQLGSPAEAGILFRQAREVLENIPRETPEQLFELAAVYAVLASPAGATEPDEADAAELRRNADLAVETLRKAVDAGFQDAKSLKSNKDLDSLRDRDDFRAILATVEAFSEADRLAKAKGADAAAEFVTRREAVDLLRGLVSAQPGQVRHRTTLAATLHSVGVIQTGLKQLDEAEQSLDEALKLRQELLREQSGSPPALLDALSTRAAIGQLRWEGGRPQDAHRLWQDLLAECRQAAADHPEHTALQDGITGIEWSIGQRYGEIGLWELALYPVDRSLKTGRLTNQSWDCRGAHMLAALGRLEEHRKFCRSIAVKWGKPIPAQTAWAASMNPRPALDAEQLLELAERVVKSEVDPLWKFKAATAYCRAGEYDRALEVMADARENVAASGSPACLYWYAIVYHKLGRHGVAAESFEQAEAKYLGSAESRLLSPETSVVPDARGGSWWAWAEDQAARRAAWIELRGEGTLKDPWHHLIQARGFRLIGEHDKSAAELAAADAETPDDPESWKLRARLATRFEDAERAWQRAVELSAHDPLAWIRRGRWYAEHGRHAKADADFTKAAALTPEELNRFLEAGWWAATTVDALAPLFPQRPADVPTPAVEPSAPGSPTAVRTEPFGQFVEFRKTPEVGKADTAYAATYVYASEAKAVTLLVGGASPAELYLNGRRVHQWRKYLSPYNLDRVPVLLRPGRNTLAARVSDPGRPLSFILRIGDTRLDRGLELAQLGLWDEALPLLKSELAEGRRLDPHVWQLYAALLPLTGDFAAHRELCQQVLSWMGEKPYWATKLHVSHVCTLTPEPQADVNQLVRLVDEGVAGAAGQAWALDIQSRVYFRAGRYQEVLDRLGTGGLRHSTLRALCWHHLGKTKEAQSDLSRAEREFVDLVSTGPGGPSSANVWNRAQGLLDIVPDYVLLHEARALIAPDSVPDDRALRALQSQVRETLRAADPELLPFETALISGGKKPHNRLERARALAMFGRWESAQADFAAAVAMAPNDPEMLAARGLVYAELNRSEDAAADVVAVLEEGTALAKSPGWPEARRRLCIELGRWPEVFERVTRRRPDDPGPWVGRARYHLSHGNHVQADDGVADPEQAMADLREAVARGFRDFDQSQAESDRRRLEPRADFQDLVREAAERGAEDLVLLAKLVGHADVVRAAAFLPDGRRIVSVGRDETVRTWDVGTRSALSTLPVEGYLRDADVSADGRLVATVSNSGEKVGRAHVWDLERQERLCVLVQDFHWTNCIRFSPDGTHVVTSGSPPYGVLWDLAGERALRRFDVGDTSATQATAFSPDGRLLALGAVGRVRLFEVEGGDAMGDVRLPNNRHVQDLVFDPSGSMLASGQVGGHVDLIDVRSREVTKTLHASDAAVLGVRFLAGGRFLVATCDDVTLRAWDVERGEVVATAATAGGTNGRLAVSPDGRHAVTAVGEQWSQESKGFEANGDYALRLWRLPRSVWDRKAVARDNGGQNTSGAGLIRAAPP